MPNYLPAAVSEMIHLQQSKQTTNAKLHVEPNNGERLLQKCIIR
jgi:hypothetical protein